MCQFGGDDKQRLLSKYMISFGHGERTGTGRSAAHVLLFGPFSFSLPFASVSSLPRCASVSMSRLIPTPATPIQSDISIPRPSGSVLMTALLSLSRPSVPLSLPLSLSLWTSITQPVLRDFQPFIWPRQHAYTARTSSSLVSEELPTQQPGHWQRACNRRGRRSDRRCAVQYPCLITDEQHVSIRSGAS